MLWLSPCGSWLARDSDATFNDNVENSDHAANIQHKTTYSSRPV
jgi:hypothetical protein